MNKTVILVTRQGLGTTPEDAEFGLEMLDKFFHTLERQPEKPYAICFYGRCQVAGRRLTVELGLKLLQKLGVRIVACKPGINRVRPAGSAGGGGSWRTTRHRAVDVAGR